MLALPLGIFSIIGFVLLLPSFAWQCSVRNMPQAMLISSLALTNLLCFLGVIIWGNTSTFHTVWDGKIYCDIVSRLDPALNYAKLSSVCTIMFHLNEILKQKNPHYIDAKSLKKRVISWCICFGFPFYGFILTFFFQSPRYQLVLHYGCRGTMALTKVRLAFDMVPLTLLTLSSVILAILTPYHYFCKKRELENILKCTNTNMSLQRFARILLMSVIVIMVFAPTNLYFAVKGVHVKVDNLSLSQNYDPMWFNRIFRRDYGIVMVMSRVINCVMSYIAFFILGTGDDAIAMYRSWLGVVWPRWKSDAYENQGHAKTEPMAGDTDSLCHSEPLDFAFEMTPYDIYPAYKKPLS